MSLLCYCVLPCDSASFSATFAHRAQRTRYQCRPWRALCTHTQKQNLLVLVRLKFVQSWSSYNSGCGNVARHTWPGQTEPKKLRTVLFFELVLLTSIRRQTACPQQQRAAHVPRHAADGVVRPTLLLLMRGRRSRRTSAVDIGTAVVVVLVVVVAPVTMVSFFEFYYVTKPPTLRVLVGRMRLPTKYVGKKSRCCGTACWGSRCRLVSLATLTNSNCDFTKQKTSKLRTAHEGIYSRAITIKY